MPPMSSQSGNFPPKNGNGGQGGSQQPDIPELRLPTKIGRGAIVQNMGQLQILVNGYSMAFGNETPQKVFKHELKFISTNKKGKERDLSRGPRNDISNILRHEALFNMYQVLLRSYPANFGDTQGDKIYAYAYDCGINFYSRGKILNLKEELKLEVDIACLRDSTRDFLSKNLEKIEAVILATDEIDLKSTSAVSEELANRDRSVVQFLEILSNQLIYNK
uniref:Uncharacterized protein n=1 Tax=Acrobeloides nanus TaxID=290746 RepID=A0A914CLH8_9BILA